MTKLKERINERGALAHNGNSYNDNPERLALRRFVRHCPEFRTFCKEYFGTNGNTIIKDDPLRKNQVDLGVVDETTSEIYGLIEVDVFIEWNPDWPKRYRMFHVLERKLKYFQSNNYKYITCSFSLNRKRMVCTTRENIEMCYSKSGVIKMWMPKIRAHDKIVRCPLNDNIKWFNL